MLNATSVNSARGGVFASVVRVCISLGVKCMCASLSCFIVHRSPILTAWMPMYFSVLFVLGCHRLLTSVPLSLDGCNPLGSSRKQWTIKTVRKPPWFPLVLAYFYGSAAALIFGYLNCLPKQYLLAVDLSSLGDRRARIRNGCF